MLNIKTIGENVDQKYLRFQANVEKVKYLTEATLDVGKLLQAHPKLEPYAEVIIEVSSLAKEYHISTDNILEHTLPAFFSNAPESIYENLKDHLISIFFIGKPKPSTDDNYLLKFENKLAKSHEFKSPYINRVDGYTLETMSLRESDLFTHLLPAFFNHASAEVYIELEQHLNTINEIFKRVDDEKIGNHFFSETFWPTFMMRLPEKSYKHLARFGDLMIDLVLQYTKRIDQTQKNDLLEKFYKDILPLFLKVCPEEFFSDFEKFRIVLYDLGTILIDTEIDINFYYLFHISFFLDVIPKNIYLSNFDSFFKPQNSSETHFLFSVLSDFMLLVKYYSPVAPFTNPQDIHNDLVIFLNELFNWGRITVLDLKKYRIAYLSRNLLKKIKMKEKIVPLLHKKFRNFPTHFEVSDEKGFALAAISLLSSADKILEDKNISYIFSIFKKYGTIANYYRNKKKSVLFDLRAAGFNTEYLLSDQAVHQASLSGINNENQSGSFEERFKNLVQGLLGTKQTQPKNIFEFNGQPSKRFKIYSKISHDYHQALSGNREAAQQVVDFFLNLLSVEKFKIKKTETQFTKKRILEEYHDLFSGLKGETTQPKISQPKGLRAIRSQFRIPEILFDNKRLGCCIFKPDGEMADEISLMILDPKTPLLEIWVEGEPDFMGIATQYLGLNTREEPVVFIDTFEANQIIFSYGKNYGQQFVLDALVKDAKNMNAKELVLFKCEYGKPLEFVNFVKNTSRKKEYEGSIADIKDYYFEAIDVHDQGLSDSKTNRHHYTDAFGDNQPLKGKRSCLVINVEEYLSLRKKNDTDF